MLWTGGLTEVDTISSPKYSWARQGASGWSRGCRTVGDLLLIFERHSRFPKDSSAGKRVKQNASRPFLAPSPLRRILNSKSALWSTSKGSHPRVVLCTTHPRRTLGTSHCPTVHTAACILHALSPDVVSIGPSPRALRGSISIDPVARRS